jgi:hypothetical protein
MVVRNPLLDQQSWTALGKSHDLDRNVAESSVHVPAGPNALPLDEEERMLPSLSYGRVYPGKISYSFSHWPGCLSH